ncbi:hypothetical protein ACIBG0_01965 [Nocardia sp. NPDC050630]|uniref:hypothetical protein n=1 Tax=Nocardia sp. NPDC050630 TaxID=3364321 RepID=UPI00379F13EC
MTAFVVWGTDIPGASRARMLHAPTEHRIQPDLVGALNRYADQPGLAAAGRLVRLRLSAARDGVPAHPSGNTARPAPAPRVAMAKYASRRIRIRHLVPAALPRPAAELVSGATAGGLA